MNYCAIKTYDVADGPGVRVSLFVAGCRRHCKGCQNASTWDFNSGKLFDETTVRDILTQLNNTFFLGLTILGGEPFEPENAPQVFELCRKVRQEFPDKTIWAYSGFTYEELMRLYPTEISECIDVLIDGPYIESQRNLNLRFRGSENQRVIDIRKSVEAGRVVSWSNPIDSDPEYNTAGSIKLNTI